jgi:hypothetical protein
MNEEAAKAAIAELQWQIDAMQESISDMNAASFDDANGVLLTGNEAKALIELWNFYQMYKPK